MADIWHISLWAMGILVALFFAFRLWGSLTNGRPLEWLRAWLGRGQGIEELARRLDLPVSDLRLKETGYRETYIPKRGHGRRRLLIPDASLKKIQKRILRRLLGKLHVHPAAMGFEKGKSIVHNAAAHVGQKVVLKLDLVDFFPATRAERVDAYFRRVGWNAEAAALLTRLCTHEGGLPQGAPTSPRLSNLVNYYFDARLAGLVRHRHGTYTRYADDLTISFSRDRPQRLRGFIQFVARLAGQFGYRLHLQHKLRVLRSYQQQLVTGLVVNSKVQLPRATRRWLRAVAHRLSTNKAATLSPKQLQGWTALMHMIAQQTGAK